MEKPKIRHIAVRAADAEKISEFLQNVFAMEVAKKTPSGIIFMTDGYLTLALIPPKAG